MGLLTGSVSSGVQNLFDGPMEADWYPGTPFKKWQKPELIGPGILGKNLSGDGCGIGYHKNAAGQCVPDKDDVCPAGQTRNASGVCVATVGACPTGQERNAAGNCVPIKTDGKCGPGFTGTPPNCVPITDQTCKSGPRKGLLPHPRWGCGSAPTSELCKTGPRAGMAPHPVYGCSDTGERPCPDGSRPNVHTGECDELGVDRCWDGMPPEADGTCNRRGTVQITTDTGLQDAPSSFFMPGLDAGIGDPASYLGADPNWAGGIDYPRSWQATTDPNTGLLRSAIYDDPAVVAAQEAMAALLSDMPESAAPTHFGTDQSLLDFGGDNVDAEEKAANNKANDAVRAAEKAESKASESGSDDDKKAANKAKRDADRAVADAAAARDDARIAAAAEASRQAEANRAAAVAAEAERQRQESAAAMANHWAWMAANEAQRKKDEENRLRNMGLLNTSNINTSNIWS